jgi:hypothetical protein
LCIFIPAHFARPGLASQALIRAVKTSYSFHVLRTLTHLHISVFRRWLLNTPALRRLITLGSSTFSLKFDFDYRGEYCDVFFDPSQFLCIHAKVGSKYASGNKVGNNPDAFWTSGFASSWNEARNILHDYCPDKYP